MNGKELRAARKAMGLGHTAFANLFGVKPGSVQAWESGKWPNGNDAVVPERVIGWLAKPYDRDEVMAHAAKLFALAHSSIGVKPGAFEDETGSAKHKWAELAQASLSMVAHRRIG